MPGRKPTPPFLKLIKGTTRRHRRVVPPPRPPSIIGMPEAPSFLDELAMVEWNKQAPVLFAAGLLTKIDGAVLGAYCSAFAKWCQAEALLVELAQHDPSGQAGLVMTTKTGRTIQHPLLAICRTQQAACIKFAEQLGLTPPSRQRINAEPPRGDGPDPAGKYLT